MNVDTKNPFLGNFLGDLTLGQKSLKSTIDRSSITSTEQQLLNSNLQKNNSQPDLSDHNQTKNKKNSEQEKKDNERRKDTSDKTERSPMKLLTIL